MAEVYDMGSSDRRAVILAGLIYKYREKEPLTVGEQRQLDDWLNENEANKQLFAELLQRPLLVAELEALNTYPVDDAVSSIFAAVGEQRNSAVLVRTKPVRRTLAAAAILLLLAAGVWLFYRYNQAVQPPSVVNTDRGSRQDRAILTLAGGRQVFLDSAHAGPLDRQGGALVQQRYDGLVYTASSDSPIVYNTLTVPRGAQYHVILADSTEIWLNAASSITYPTSFPATSREVTLTGEAYFAVARTKTVPFTVTVRSMKVQVLGTEFDIMAYDDEPAIRTTLIKGAVVTSVTDERKQSRSLALQPGEQATLDQNTGLLRLGRPNLDEVIGWHYGEFRCHETELPVIMRQIARWYDVTIEYRGSVGGIAFDGQLSRKHRLEDVLDILADTRKVHFERKTPGTIVVIPGPKK